ncbi:MAG: hypothetical protein OEM62_01565 [Acidobacteriota bacterium]|nr:hypothetical protein [Acidobacteriota bacterium]
MTPEQQRRGLIASVAILTLVVGWRFVLPLVRSGGEPATSFATSALRDGVPPQFLEALRLADLDLEPGEFKVGRDPFRFVVARKGPRKKPVPAPDPAPAQSTPPPPPRQGKPLAPQPPPVDVVYLGRFGPVSRPIAVFSDGDDIFNVLQGSVIKGVFVVDMIGYESADLKFVDFPDAPAKRLAVGG